MTTINIFSSASRVLVMGTLLAAVNTAFASPALFTLKGETLDAKLTSEAEVRVSVLGWTAAEQANAVVEAFRQFQSDQNADAFAKVLQQQDTQGYVFTKEATGYTIKYAWQSADALDKRMVLLVTPGVKTRNPYMWKEKNETPAFSLMEVRWQGDEAIMTSSTDYPITIDLNGRLELQDDAQKEVFARLRDDTPYYLKNRS